MREAQEPQARIEARAPTVAQYLRLRRAVGWRDTDPDASAQGLKNSLFALVALQGDRVIGCGRVVGDGGLYFYIQDVMIHPAYQRQGLGRKLVGELMAYIREHARPSTFVGLMAAKGMEGFYRRFGFTPRPSDAPGMFQILD